MKLCMVSVVLMFIITSYKGSVTGSSAELSGTQCINTYPVSHDRESPDLKYHIGYVFPSTLETCQDWCNDDVRCRSVRYRIGSGGMRYCDMFNISVQELKDSGRDSEVYRYPNADIWPTWITYDKHCAEISGPKCTNIYPVSHDWESPDLKWHIGYIYVFPATAEICQDWCNDDVNCRSVLHRINVGGGGYCGAFNISVQEIKDTGRDSEIYTETDTAFYTSYITYDRYCGTKCTNAYLVSHDRESPPWYRRIDSMGDDNATPETCQDYCNKDVECRSVTYQIQFNGFRTCQTFSISLLELKDTGRDSEVFTNNNTNSLPTLITYDRYCAEVSGTKCTNTYPVSHDRESPGNRYLIDITQDDSATPEICQNYCNKDVRCRSVEYSIDDDGDRYCDTFNISVQELKDTGRDSEIKTINNTDANPTFITFDRYCFSVCDNLSTVKGTVTCLPIGHADKTTCHAIPDCCFIELEILGVPSSMCVRPKGV